MWVKCGNKTIFLDLNKYFLNLGNIENDDLKKIVEDSKVNEVVRLLLPKFMIPDIQKAFAILDYKKRGTLGPRDIKVRVGAFQVTLRAMGIEPTAFKVKRLIDRSSADKQNELSREEYENMMIHVLNDVDSEEQMKKAFRSFDANNKHFVTYEDLKKIAEHLQLDIADEEIKEMVDFADSDNDGQVTLEEFIDAARKIF